MYFQFKSDAHCLHLVYIWFLEIPYVYYVSILRIVCMCVRVCMCVYACVRMCICTCVCTCMCVYVCLLLNPNNLNDPPTNGYWLLL